MSWPEAFEHVGIVLAVCFAIAVVFGEWTPWQR